MTLTPGTPSTPSAGRSTRHRAETQRAPTRPAGVQGSRCLSASIRPESVRRAGVLAPLALAACGIAGSAFAQVDPAAVQALDPGALAGMNPRDAAGVILREVMDRDAARKSETAQYGVRSHPAMAAMAAPLLMGDTSTLQLREKVYCTDPVTGELSFTWRQVTAPELQSRLDQADPNGLNATGAELRGAASGMAEQSLTINDRLSAEGIPVDLLSGIGAPMAPQMGMNVLDPSDYFAAYSIFLSAAADARDLANSPDRGAAACSATRSTDALAESARYAGTEEIDGRMAAVVEVTDLGLTQPVEGGMEATFRKASVAIDLARAVPLRTRIEGEVRQGRDTRPLVIEKREQDYRNVPGSDLYESYRQVLSLSGWTELGPEAAEAQAQMAELEQQLASVPASQRAMMERMLGPQLEMIRRMASGGGIEVEVVVDEIVVDPGIPGGPAESALELAANCPAGLSVQECLEELAGN